MKLFIYLTLSLTLLSVPAHALVINTSAGKLAEHKMLLELTSESDVIIKGTANAVDLSLLKSISPKVKTLDLSALSVEAYEYPSNAVVDQYKFTAGEIPASMLAGAGISQFIFPANASIIGKGAFASSKVETLTIPATVTAIGDYAFAACENLRSVKCEGNSSLGKGVFKDCKSLEKVNLPSGITDIPVSTFDGCVKYAEAMPSCITSIGDYAYRGTALTSLSLRNVNSIGAYAFAEMPDLESIEYSANNRIDMGTGAFFKDSALEILPVFIADIAPAALAHAGGKSHYVIKSPNISLGAYANNPTIDTITLGSEVKYIARDAFRNLSNLKLIDAAALKTNVPDTDEEAFSGLRNAEGRYDIELNVRKENQAPWLEHPVWSLFKVGQYDTGIADSENDANRIDIIRSGNVVGISSDAVISYAGVFSIDGIKLAEITPCTRNVEIVNIPADEIIIVKVQAGDLQKVAKLR